MFETCMRMLAKQSELHFYRDLILYLHPYDHIAQRQSVPYCVH